VLFKNLIKNLVFQKSGLGFVGNLKTGVKLNEMKIAPYYAGAKFMYCADLCARKKHQLTSDGFARWCKQLKFKELVGYTAAHLISGSLGKCNN
jgi:hypothetical protein